jgi:hypothetical protein
MAIDQTLVKGAFAANAPTGVPGLKEMQDMNKSVTDNVKSYMEFKYKESEAEKLALQKQEKELAAELKKEKEQEEKDNKEFRKHLTTAANRSKLTGEEYKFFTNRYKDGAALYANADFSERTEIISQINEDAQQVEELFNITEQLAVGSLEGNNISPYWLNNKGKELVKAVVDPNNAFKEKDGNFGYNVNGEFKSVDDINAEIQKNLKDTGFAKAILAIKEDQIKKSGKVASGKDLEFNAKQTKDKINTLLNSSEANLMSIAADPMLGSSESFIDHLTEGLLNQSYDNLIGKQYKKDYDKNGNEKLDKEEAENIINHLLEVDSQGNFVNEKDLKAELSYYYTSIIERDGFNVGKNNRVIDISNNKDEEIRKETLRNEVNIYMDKGDAESMAAANYIIESNPDVFPPEDEK